MAKESNILLGAVILSMVLTIGAVFIIVQGGVAAVQRSNASVADAYNRRLNRIEAAIASPMPSAPASATPSAASKRPVKPVVPSAATQPSPAQ
jgi:hypothetical protein